MSAPTAGERAAEEGAARESVGGQRAYWDANLDVGNIERDLAAFDYARERRFFLASPELRHALRELEPLERARIVDLGAGLGVAAAIFAERGARVEAVDLAPRRLACIGALAGRLGLGDRIACHEAGAESLPFEDASIDRLFTRSVLIHTDLPAALAEAHRVLRPGGRAVFVEPMARNPPANFYRRFLGPAEWRTIARYFTEERIGSVRAAFPTFRERRFHLVGFGAYAFQFALSSPALFRGALAVTHLVDRPLLALVPPLRSLAWFTVMTAQK